MAATSLAKKSPLRIAQAASLSHWRKPSTPGSHICICVQNCWPQCPILPLYISVGRIERGLIEAEDKKEKEVGGVAIQHFANQAEKSCITEEPKSLQAKSFLLPWLVHSAAKGSRGAVFTEQRKKSEQVHLRPVHKSRLLFPQPNPCQS